MELQYEWPAALMAVGTVLIGCAGLAFIFGGRRLGKKLLQLGVVAAVVGAAVDDMGLASADWRAWLPDGLDADMVVYGLYAIGFLVAMNLLRHLLALFVGYGAADSATGNLLATVITSVFAMLVWPFRALRRIGRSSHSPFDDP